MVEEGEFEPYALSFEPIEIPSTFKEADSIYIGNSGGVYIWSIGSDFFEQHFTPDGVTYPADNRKDQLKYTTLYPAAIYSFLIWQDKLPAGDPRKKVKLIEGKTNETMSNFRQKLLGEAYIFTSLEKRNSLGGPSVKYQIDLELLRKDEKLMEKLKSYLDRAKAMNYTMIIPVPKLDKEVENLF